MIGLVLLCKQVVESLSLYEISSPDIGYVRYAVRTHAASSQTASKKKPDSFGTVATSCKKSNKTADISISTPTKTATNPCTGTQPDQHGNKYPLKNAHKKEKLCI